MAWNPEGWQPEGWQPEGWQPQDSGSPTPGSQDARRARFFARYGSMRTYFFARWKGDRMSTSDELVFADIRINAGEVHPVELDLYTACVSEWRAGDPVDLNEYKRPRTPNGFAYQATVAGETGAVEPFWPKTIDALRQDGSVTWKCVAPASNAVNAISEPAAQVTLNGLTVGSISVSEDRKILATYQSADLGAEYLVEWTFTLDGRTRKAHQRVLVVTK